MKPSALLFLPLGLGALGAPGAALAEFRVHEWGTFTSLVGSDGRTQPGMYHEDERLPEFVHKFGETVNAAPPAATDPSSRDPRPPRPPRPCRGKGCFPADFLSRNAVTQKMETPVLYFYSDRARSVEVNVRFPQGAVGETFPGPALTFPRPDTAPVLAGGDTTFRIDVLSPEESRLAAARIPEVDPSNIYGHARLPRSNVVRAGDEHEKFVFYRGIGTYQPETGIHSVGDGLTLVPRRTVSAAMLVHVDEGGDGQMLPLGALRGGLVADLPAERVRALRDHASSRGALRGEAMREALIGSLAEAGLSADEATAMVDTWERGYLKVPGLRLLLVLPRTETDAVLPLTVSPRPDSVERVFVARIEVLTAHEERLLLERVFEGGESFQAASLGRFAEPTLRRLLEVYRQSEAAPAPERVGLLRRLIDQAAAME